MIANNFQATIDWYDKHAEDYSLKIKSKINFEELKQFLSYLTQDAKVLDAGCAAGRDSKVLKKFGCNVLGIDLSKRLLQIASKENPDVDFIKADILDLPFEDGILMEFGRAHLWFIWKQKRSF